MIPKLPVACISAIAISSSLYAQELPPPIERPKVDAHGIELQSGRYGGLNVPIVSIGTGPAALVRKYGSQDGREVIVVPIFTVHSSPPQVIMNNVNYDVYTYQYPGGNEKFRTVPGSGLYEPEFTTGSTLEYSDGELVFTDKYGVKIIGNTIIFPDGRKVRGGGRRSGVDPYFFGIFETSNNFGFRIRLSRSGDTYLAQAVNMAIDYCDEEQTSPCSNLTEVRAGTEYRPTRDEVILTNAVGETTRILLEAIEAYDSEPDCIYRCDGTRWAHYYPTEIYYPNSIVPDVSLTYRGSDSAHTVSHSEIILDTLQVSGMEIQNSGEVLRYAAGGSQPTGFQVYAAPFVNGVQLVGAWSTNVGGSAWPASNLEMQYIKDANGAETRFSYNALGEISEIRFAGGGRLEHLYDERFNVTKIIRHPDVSSGDEPLVTTFEYPDFCTPATQTTCNLPKVVIDPNGNTSEYTYNDRGQLLTATGPAPTANAARPTTRNEYTERTAYILDGNGGLEPAGPPISLLTRTSQCLTSENCEGTADEVVTEYDYGPVPGPGVPVYATNLLLRGVAVTAADESGQLQTLRTCYAYNYFGERVSETSPRADLEVCP